MKAIILKEFGGIEKLLLTELPLPTILENEVLIEVKAISINPVDVRTRSGIAMADHLKHYNPLILGWDISGVVTSMGAKVSKFKKGDNVFGMVNFLGHGKGYAEYVASSEEHIAYKPSNISHEEAAAATLSALTAWQLLVHYAKLKPGNRILIQAASGGVGHYAVQIAKHFGCYVIGVSSSKNRQFVLGLGADEHIAYDEQQFEDVVSGVDFVLDAFAKDSLNQSLKVIKNGGTIISLLPMISEDVLQKAKKKNVDIHYSLVESNGADMEAIADLLKRGTLKSHVSQIFSFDKMGEAHIEMETGRTVGKIIVKPR
jgi:NADPH:quinone reductase-like Zn-dependent oxidoreductase